MDGDIAPLDKICEISNAHDILPMVDDAHGEGVLGKRARYQTTLGCMKGGRGSWYHLLLGIFAVGVAAGVRGDH